MTSDHTLEDAGSMRTELRALDPDRDPLAENRFAASFAARIAARTADGSATRALVPVDPLYGLWSLPRPLLLAASIVAAAILGVASGAGAAPAGGPATVAESIGVPTQLLATGSRH